MVIPGISNSLLKSKSSFHICHTKSTCLLQAPVNTVTHAVLVKDDEPTMVKIWKIAKQTGGTQRSVSSTVGQHYVFPFSVCLA